MLKGKPFRILLALSAALISGRAEALDCHVLHPGFRALATPSQFLGNKRILWYRLAYAQDARAPATTETANTVMTEANAIVQRISFAQASLTWDVTPLLQLPRTAAFYSTNVFRMVDDARVEAAKAGFNSTDYDRDLVSPPQMNGWSQGMAPIDGRWLYIGYPHAGLVVHELGHSYGLPHANSWETIAPAASPVTSPPFPSNVGSLTESFAFDTSSLVARASVMFPGAPTEYGDTSDIMGWSSPTANFNAVFKQRLGWLPTNSVANIFTSGTYRIHTQAAARINGGLCALRIDQTVVGRHSDKIPRHYFVEMLPGAPDSLALRWFGPNLNHASQIVDASPTGLGAVSDCALRIGRAFDDPGLGLSITALAGGGDASNGWMDVRVEFNAGNRAAVNPPQPHDPLDVYRISGRVVDTIGNPLPNCVVNNGRDRWNFASTETDAQGNYTLWVADSIFPHTIGASVYGYRLVGDLTERAITIPESGVVSNIDFVFERLPTVSIAAPTTIFGGETAAFTISRNGATNAPLEVWWQTSGTADDLDYSGPFGSGRAVIPAGSRSITLPIATVASTGPSKQVSLHAVLPGSFPVGAATHHFPGWELRGEGPGRKWFQTDPPYAVFADSAATVTINADAGACRLRIVSGGLLEIRAPIASHVRVETSADFKNWREVTTTQMDNSTVSIPVAPATATAFYRATILTQ